MKTLLVKLQFKLASWLYNQGIIAPQLLTKEDGSAVPYESAPTRVYEGMMATLPNGNGMRLFFLSNGGPIRPEWSDVDPADA